MRVITKSINQILIKNKMDRNSINDYIDVYESVSITNLPIYKIERKIVLKEIFSKENVLSYDFSTSNLNDADMKYICRGLKIRSKNSDDPDLKLLDLSNKTITQKGIKKLFTSLSKENFKTFKIKNVIIKVSFGVDLSQELLDSLEIIAPGVLKIVSIVE